MDVWGIVCFINLPLTWWDQQGWTNFTYDLNICVAHRRLAGSPSLLRTSTLRARRHMFVAQKHSKTGNIKVDRPGKSDSDAEEKQGKTLGEAKTLTEKFEPLLINVIINVYPLKKAYVTRNCDLESWKFLDVHLFDLTWYQRWKKHLLKVECFHP